MLLRTVMTCGKAFQRCCRWSLVLVAASLCCTLVYADAIPTVALTSGVLNLTSDTDTSFAENITAEKSNGSVTIDANPATNATGKTLTLNGALTMGFYTTLNVTSAHDYTLALPMVTTSAPGPALNPTTAKLAIGTMTGNITLGGTSTGNTLHTFTGTTLTKSGTGEWMITGNNATRSFNTSITGGTLTVAKDASLGTGSISVNGCLAPQAGAKLVGYLNMQNGSTLNLADGVIGPCTLDSPFSGPNGGRVTLICDLSDQGVDQLNLKSVSTTNAIQDLVQFHPMTEKLKEGTYTFVTLADEQGNLAENHFGFTFKPGTNPADHTTYTTSQTLNGYTLTLSEVLRPGGSTKALLLTIVRAATP